MRKGKEFQLSLFNMKTPNVFGGSLLKNSNPKTKRPVATKSAMHIVLRSSLAKGQRRFLNPKNSKVIDQILRKRAKALGIRLYRYENVDNHLHLLIKVSHRKWLMSYLRAITGLIARHILKAQRGSAKNIKFWDARPFSRIVHWGKAYKALHNYFDKNRLQAVGYDLRVLSAQLTALKSNTS